MNKILTLDKKHNFILERILGEYKKRESDPIDVIRRVHIANNLRTNPLHVTPNNLIEVISILDELGTSGKVSQELIIELKIDISEVMKSYKFVLIDKRVRNKKNGYKIFSKHQTNIS